VYDADDLGHSIVLVDEVSGDLEQHAAVGQQNCPESAISLSR
jgi:ferredoxin